MLEVLFHQADVQGNCRYADVDQARSSLSQQVAVGTRQGTTVVNEDCVISRTRRDTRERRNRGALGPKHKPLNGINLNHLSA